MNHILKNKNMVEIHSVYESNNSVNLVFENLTGGPIADYKSPGSIREIGVIRRIIYQTLQGLEYLESQNIVHRDIKPKNVIFADKSQKKTKIIDLGLAIESNSPGCSIAGTPGFIDPELFTHSSLERGKFISSKIDVFSLGVVLHFYLFGKFLFRGVTREEIFEKNKKGDLKLGRVNEMITDFRSVKAYDLMKRMTQVRQENRVSIQEALDHPFFDSMRKEDEKNEEEDSIPDDPLPKISMAKYGCREKKFMSGLKKCGNSKN